MSYPINLDYNYQQLFVSFFRAINKHFKPASISDLEEFEKVVYPKLIKEVQNKAKPKISQNFKLINEHSKRLTKKSIERFLTPPFKGAGGRIKLLSLDFIPDIPSRAWQDYFSPRSDSLAITNILPESQIKSIIEKNGDLITKKYFEEFENIDTTLINTLYKDHISKVKGIMLNSLKDGESHDDMVKKIMAATNVSENRARFWATDQSSKFFGAVQKARQTYAGFTGYIWRTQMDKRVRQTHISRHGMYIEWATSTLNPGEDFRCRCYSEPSFGDNVPSHFQSVREFENRKFEQNFETGAGEIAYKSWYDKLQKEAQESYDALRKGKAGVSVVSVLQQAASQPPKPAKFTPAKTIDEAKEYTKTLLGQDSDYKSDVYRFGDTESLINSAIDISSKLSLEKMNILNKEIYRFSKLCDKLGIPRIRGVSYQDKESPAMSMGDGHLKIYKNYKPGDAIYSNQFSLNNNNSKPRFVDAYFKPGTNRFINSLRHEFAHHIHQQLGVTDKVSYKNPHLEGKLEILFRTNKINSPSTYGEENYKEFFAETYSLYKMGRRDLIHKDIIKFFKENKL